MHIQEHLRKRVDSDVMHILRGNGNLDEWQKMTQ